MAIEKIDKIKKIGKKFKPQRPVAEPNKDYFESLMKQRRVKTEETATEQKALAKKTENTLFDEVRELNQKVDHATRSSPGELAAQADDVIAQIDILKDKLQTPDLEIKNSVQTILRKKLNHIDENLKVALDRAGVEYKPPEKPTSLAKPVDRFLGLLTHAQNQLSTLGEDVRTMSLMDGELSPANMLLIQVKVSYIQQEMELFTSMLNKALESTKTIMNVQV
jgi:flagellar hook-basal body complex protein FliE